MSASQLLLRRLKVLYRLLSTFYRFLTIVVSVFGGPVAGVVVVGVVRKDSSKSASCALHGPIDEGQLRNVVFVDHAQHGLLFLEVCLRLLNLLLVRRLKFSETVIWDQTKRLLMGFSVETTKGFWHAT